MHRDRKRISVAVDRYTQVCLTVIAVLLTVLIVGLWADGVPSAKRAGAENPRLFGDSASQRDELTKLQQQTIDKLDELISLLKSGQVRVQTVQAAEAPGPGGRAVNELPTPRE